MPIQSAAWSARSSAWSKRKRSRSCREAPARASVPGSGAAFQGSRRSRSNRAPHQASVDQFIGRQRQELDEFVRQRNLVEDPSGLLEAPATVDLLAIRLTQPGQLLVLDPADEVSIHYRTLGQVHAIVHPLPDLRARNLGGGGVFHQVVDGRCAVAA